MTPASTPPVASVTVPSIAPVERLTPWPAASAPSCSTSAPQRTSGRTRGSQTRRSPHIHSGRGLRRDAVRFGSARTFQEEEPRRMLDIYHQSRCPARRRHRGLCLRCCLSDGLCPSPASHRGTRLPRPTHPHILQSGTSPDDSLSRRGGGRALEPQIESSVIADDVLRAVALAGEASAGLSRTTGRRVTSGDGELQVRIVASDRRATIQESAFRSRAGASAISSPVCCSVNPTCDEWPIERAIQVPVRSSSGPVRLHPIVEGASAETARVIHLIVVPR